MQGRHSFKKPALIGLQPRVNFVGQEFLKVRVGAAKVGQNRRQIAALAAAQGFVDEVDGGGPAGCGGFQSFEKSRVGPSRGSSGRRRRSCSVTGGT